MHFSPNLSLKASIASLLLSVSVHATDFNWNAAVNGNWGDTTKWSPSGAPSGIGDSATISATGSAYEVSLEAPFNVGELTLDSSEAALKLGAFDLTVSTVANLNSGTIGGSGGRVRFDAGALLNFGNTHIGTDNVELQNATLSISNDSTGTGTIHMEYGATLVGDIKVGQTIDLGRYASLQSNAGYTNGGEILLNGENNPYGYLSVDSGALNNMGALKVGNSRYGNVGANLINNGTVLVEADGSLTFFRTGGNFISNGNFTLETGAEVLVQQGSFTQAAGTLSNQGSFKIVAGTAFHFNGGTITGNAPVLENATLSISNDSTGTGMIQLKYGVTLVGDVKAGQILDLEQSANLHSNTGYTNGGEILLNGDNNMAPAAYLSVSSGILSNTGTLKVTNDSYGRVSANLTNNGTVMVEADGSLTLSKAGGNFTNNGNFTLQAGAELVINNGTHLNRAGVTFTQSGGMLNLPTNHLLQMGNGNVVFNGGSINGGAVALDGGNLTIGNGATGTGVFQFQNHNTLTGNVSAGLVLNLNGMSGIQRILASGGFINAGQINVGETVIGGIANLEIAGGGTLTNTGALTFIGSSLSLFTGQRSLVANLINNGSVEVQENTVTKFENSNGDYLNNADFTIIGKLVLRNTGSLWNGTTGTLRGTGTVEIEAGSSFTNAGTIAPGLSPGTLTIMGDVPFENTASLEIELGGISNYDLLHVLGGDVFLDGMLEIALINGFTPGYNDIFTILMADSITGAFDNISGNTVSVPGGAFEVVQSANQLQLIHYVPEPASGLLMLLGSTAFALRRKRPANF